MQSEIPVTHNLSASRFEIAIGAHVAVADYVVDGDRVVFTHTLVPPELRGRGLAERLVRAGLDWARRENRRVVPQCSYVAVFIQRNREYADLVA